MNYKEVIKHIETIDLKSQFLTVSYDESDKYFYAYLLTGTDDDDEDVVINCQVAGGIPFESDVVEDYFDIEEAVSLIEKLHFKPYDDSLDVMYVVADHMLFKLFPMLPDPENIWTKSEQLNFINLAKRQIEKTWAK